MIKKFLKLKNLGVFKDFEWDTFVKDDKGQTSNLGGINILYGRNYSGKTTLSRVFRYLESGVGLEKYVNASLELELEDGKTLTRVSEAENPLQVRVFNEDFVREKLYFVNDLNGSSSVAPFAVFGDNADIEREIQSLRDQLGDSTEGQETKLYLDRVNTTKAWKDAEKEYRRVEEELQERLSKKATDRQQGIKYKSDLYGDQNYTVAKLKVDISNVRSTDQLLESEIDLCKQSLREQYKTIPSIEEFRGVDFASLNERGRVLVEQAIVAEGKIAELVSDAMANKWVEEGYHMHEGKDCCLFCGNSITSSRWQQLEQHYDQSTKELQDKLSEAEKLLIAEIQRADDMYALKVEDYYQKFQVEVQAIIGQLDDCRNAYVLALKRILEQVKQRKSAIHTVLSYTNYHFDFEQLQNIHQQIRSLISQAQEYGDNLSHQQAETKKKLRLSEVSRFKEDIGYERLCADVYQKEQIASEKNSLKEEAERKITELEKEIAQKERLRLNEEAAAVKVNQILQSYFGHQYIELRAIEGTDGVQFDVCRQGEKAYNLSEGERNLVAFAYFVAKLEDVDTKSTKPIIWIDDPISSLDSNHIFFIYSLISQEIVDNGDKWSQLFLSTHNLEFLRYLKRIGKGKGYKRWLLIERKDDVSILRCMPKYMELHVTEFNYLFHQIYKCSRSSVEEDYELFYSFGNNARKFLEMYLYYKYPDNEKEFTLSKLKNFFGDTSDTGVVHRLTNEMSHLNGLFERGMTIIESSEAKKCAQFILDTIKLKDPEQYKALCDSIGECDDY